MRKPSEYFAETNTDKVSRHGYGVFYDAVFNQLWNSGIPLRVLEIGVSEWGLGSAHAFHAMPFVAYVGMDIEPMKESFPAASPTQDVSCFIHFNAYCQRGVEMAAEHAPYNLIIDDGSHDPADQIYFFEQYYGLLHFEGVMVCEDVHKRYLDADAYRQLEPLGVSLVRPSYFGGADDSNLLVLWND